MSLFFVPRKQVFLLTSSASILLPFPSPPSIRKRAGFPRESLMFRFTIWEVPSLVKMLSSTRQNTLAQFTSPRRTLRPLSKYPAGPVPSHPADSGAASRESFAACASAILSGELVGLEQLSSSEEYCLFSVHWISKSPEHYLAETRQNCAVRSTLSHGDERIA